MDDLEKLILTGNKDNLDIQFAISERRDLLDKENPVDVKDIEKLYTMKIEELRGKINKLLSLIPEDMKDWWIEGNLLVCSEEKSDIQDFIFSECNPFYKSGKIKIYNKFSGQEETYYHSDLGIIDYLREIYLLSLQDISKATNIVTEATLYY